MRSWYRDIYRGYWGAPQMRRLFERFPNYMIWDDHEIKDGWGSYTNAELANELDSIFEWQNTKENLRLAHLMFEAAKATYLEYQHGHNPPTTPGVFDYDFSWGEWPFFVFDMRGQRDFNRKTNKILGTAQMGRFVQWMKSPAVKQAPALFIVSPVPVVHISNFIVNYLDIPMLGLADDLRDEWEHDSNWTERNKMLDLVFEHAHASGKPVVFLSGDVHVAAAFKLFRPAYEKANVFQLTSSGITYAAQVPGLKFAVRDQGQIGDTSPRKKNDPIHFRLLHRVIATNNFALISAKNTGGMPEIKWDVYASTGEGDDVMGLKTINITG